MIPRKAALAALLGVLWLAALCASAWIGCMLGRMAL